MWYVGIDWADTHHDVLALGEDRRQAGSLRVSHTQQGLEQLTRFLLDIAKTPEQIACIVETNQGLLITALLEAGFTVYPVNPKTLDHRRNAAGAKADAIDAYLLAKTGLNEWQDLRPLKPDNAVVPELKSLTRDQDSLIESQTRLVNQLTACLKTYYPVALHLFAKVQQPSTLLFLQTYPTLQGAMMASREEIEATLRAAHHSNPCKATQHIWAMLHQPHLQADEITTRTKSRLMLALISQLLPLVEQIAE